MVNESAVTSVFAAIEPARVYVGLLAVRRQPAFSFKNAIVCWNYLYLSRELAAEKNEKRRAELIEAIRHGSAVTWQHFNLHGEFDFSDERMVDSMGLAASPKNPAFE
jgi:hypothetical protein